MRPYEVMVIFDAELEDSDVRAAVERATGLIKSKGAELGHVDFWGKRRFAYRLKHRWELNRTLALADEVLRHKVLRIPEVAYGPPKTAGSPAPAEA